MKHEAFFCFALEGFQTLHVVGGAEGGCYQRLGFASSEDCASVGAWQHSYFYPDVADLVEGAMVRTAFVVDHFFAEDSFAESFVVVLQLRQRFFVIFWNVGFQLFADVFYQRVAFGLGMLLGVQRVGQVCSDFFLQAVVVGLIEDWRNYLSLLLSSFVAEFVNCCADFFDFCVAELDGINDCLFFYLFRAGLDHHNAFGGADDHDVQ